VMNEQEFIALMTDYGQI